MVIPRTYGRMGNFLFQAATAIGYALRHGLEFTLPNTTKDANGNPIYLQHLWNPRWNPRLPKVRLEEGPYCYQIIPFKETWRKQNIELDGYWQSETYFKACRDEILNCFGFDWRHKPGVVSVHVRRGDYLTLQRKHPLVTVDWIERAMAKFEGNMFCFFSDDIAWCRNTFGHRGDCWFSTFLNEQEDLVQMSCCEHHICSASTFSWWGAWLNQNPNKRILIPSWWFTPGYQGLDTKDIVPKEWERMT